VYLRDGAGDRRIVGDVALDSDAVAADLPRLGSSGVEGEVEDGDGGAFGGVGGGDGSADSGATAGDDGRLPV
jgi:hypothetical protein